MSKKPNAETPEQTARRRQKEARELARWRKEASRPQAANYFVILMIIVAVVYVVDEVSTNIGSTMQSLIVVDLFHITGGTTSQEYASALSTLGSLGLVSVVFSLIMPFYKSLCDRYGRKLFLAINTVGMGIGMLLTMLCPNIAVYIIGLVIIAFVTPNDIQNMYIMEVAPIKHRGKLANGIKAIGILGIATIGPMRLAFVSSSDPQSWRMVYLIPTIAAVAAGLLSVFFVRESPVFLKDRIAYLESSDEERRAKAELESKEKAAKPSIGTAFRFILAHKQLRNLAICGFVFIFITGVSGYYESIMATAGMEETQRALAVTCYPLMYAPITLCSGFFSDRFGRKRTCQVFGVVATVSLFAYIMACKYVGNGILCGLLWGAFVGGLWSTSDTIFFIASQESAPTWIRASVVGVFCLIAFVGGLIGVIPIIVLMNFVDLGWLCMAITVPFMAAALILITKRMGETKDVDMSTVTGAEWD